MKTQIKQVEQTTEYDQFRTLAHNRDINKAHVNRLAEAMTEKPGSGPTRPILVNEKMEIIDGQHRFLACQLLGIPIYYLIGEGLRLEDAQRLNALQRNWGELDYAKSYADAGDPHYQAYLDYRGQHKLSHSVVVAYLGGTRIGQKDTLNFRNGGFRVKDRAKADKYAEQLNDIGKYHPYYRQKSFGLAYLTLMQHPDYDHKLMVRHAKLWAEKFLKNTSDIRECQRNLEALYNFRLSEANQIRLF